MSTAWIAISAMALIGVGLPIGMITLSSLLRPSVPEDGKRQTYESGEIPTGGTRFRFNVQYYMVALLFVIFDVETAFIFPWVVTYRDALEGEPTVVAVLAPMLAFLAILVVGLIWAWRNGAVSWARSESTDWRSTQNQ
ncbi:NADH:ubiquinone oxidoreductase subunit 3 (chain A) [Halovivax ruber XH-70]|uniref:NADH:ubiquinone oxidoreductase subunit 3 (Chain A) n=1 Tax=Halovivax ruber (strain DSM 18193 / JCM 13892 / XH-70) TaxID=797302 RepID=L0I796_HALRX|nr:NADH-quinone oxidoreductase subunit A [Halovivax ruber]AGB15430.1 NADH:ubiquinone oxidoreductase subunit 3 (chain A) [Halovivax ruber XH-70]